VAVTLYDVPAHKTHHYMLLWTASPAHDKNSDGLAFPHGPQEKHTVRPAVDRACSCFFCAKRNDGVGL